MNCIRIAARFLVDNFDVILLPTFETSNMSRKATRKIRSKTVRNMLSFGHYRFEQFLKHKATERGSLVVDVCEAYTSKTVSWTGEIRAIGGAKTDTFLLTFINKCKMLTHPGRIYQSPQEYPASAIYVSIHHLSIKSRLNGSSR